MQLAALFGVGLGVLCLLYSGWYQWSAPGFLVAALIVFPWRDWKRGLLFCGIAGVAFGACVLRYVMGFRAGSGIKDSYFSVDALIDPTYFATWRGGAPGDMHWQPLGELAGVGVFTLVLAVGLGIALALGRRRPMVIALVSIVAGCWVLRLWHAHNMWTTKLVQLWPRTSAEILFCLLVLCVVAVYLLVERTEEKSPWRSPSATIAVIVSLILVVMSASAATTDQYLPRNVERSTGELAWMAQRLARRKPSVAVNAQITTSSSFDGAGFSVTGLVDGNRGTGFSSALRKEENHEESIELHWGGVRTFSHIFLYPMPDAGGFPLDFVIEVWDGAKWIVRREIFWAPEPYEGLLVELFEGGIGGSDTTEGVRIRATRLRKAAGSGDYALRLGEIELR
jgi:hypothetical protein